MTEPILCGSDTCNCITNFELRQGNVRGGGYSSWTCTVCNKYTYYKCNSCTKMSGSKKHDQRWIKKHVQTEHQSVIDLPPDLGARAVDDEDSVISDDGLSDDDELFEDAYEDTTDLFVADSESMDLEIDYDEAALAYSESFSPANIDLAARLYPDFGNPISDAYYEQDFRMYHEEGENFGGIRGVCWRSRYKVELNGVRHLSTIEDTRLMFNITSLLKINTGSSNELLYKILTDITDRMDADFDSANPGVRIPRNENEARGTYLKGKFGIFNNLPSPTVHDVGGHACMKISDVLAQHLAQGRDIEFTETPAANSRIHTGIHGCVAMSELLEKMKTLPPTNQQSYFAYATTWEDSFIRSYVKQKLNNVWLYTLTLPDPNHSATSPYHTYCMAVGAGALDHTPVIDWYSKQIEELMHGKEYYCAVRRMFIHVKLGIVAVLCDRPEKAFALKTAFLGLYGQIASWAAQILPDVLPDCKRCFLRRKSALLNDRHSPSGLTSCNACCQWDLNSSSQSRKKVVTPDKYPTSSCPEAPEAPEGRPVGVRYIVPVRQSFQWLKSVVTFAAHNVSAGIWNKGVMQTYLQTCSVAASVHDYIWKSCNPKASNDEGVTDAEESQDSDEDGEVCDGYNPVVSESSGVIPALWESIVLMSAYLDCGMHLIFHGVLATLVVEMESFLADHLLTQKFERLANAYMVDIQSHRLEWCKMKYFPKKQWLAENELALARIIPFIYGLLFLNLDFPARCNTTDAKKKSVQQMFHTFYVMVCMLMSPRDPGGSEIDEHVKMFLSCTHRFCKSYYDRDVKPFWSSTGNFPTLLCLGEQRKRHGPVRWYWEGTSERFIQQLKKILTAMRRTTKYFAGKLSQMHRRNVMDWLSDQLDSDGVGSESRKPRMYYQYETLEEIQRRISLGEVLSGFTLKDNPSKLIIAYGKKRRSGFMSCVEIRRINKGSARKCIGLAYVKVQLETKVMEKTEVPFMENRMVNYFLMLPLIDNGNFDSEFAVVYDDWDVGDENFRKCLPVLCSACLQDDVLA